MFFRTPSLPVGSLLIGSLPVTGHHGLHLNNLSRYWPCFARYAGFFWHRSYMFGWRRFEIEEVVGQTTTNRTVYAAHKQQFRFSFYSAIYRPAASAEVFVGRRRSEK